MRSTALWGVIGVMVILLAGQARAWDGNDTHPRQSQPRLGMNLNGPADWNSGIAVCRRLPLLAHLGQPEKRPAVGQWAGAGPGRARLGQAAGGGLLGGNAALLDRRRPLSERQVLVLYQGSGKLDIWGAATVAPANPAG